MSSYVLCLPLYDSESWLSVTVTYVVCLCMVQRAGLMSPYVLCLPLYDSDSWLSITVCFVVCLCIIQRAGLLLINRRFL